MNRREALIRVAGLMGGTLSASALLALQKVYAAADGLAGGASPAGGNGPPAKKATPTGPSVLSASQKATVSCVVDVMIPRTDTPGAVDVGVPGFIDLLLRDVYTQADRDRYLAGLADFDAAASSENGPKFAALELKQQAALVKKSHDAAVAEERRQRAAHAHLQRPFILMTKELTLLGFFTSEVGATQVLQYVAVPGSYHGCLPLEKAGNGKTWAVEPGIRF
jgi:gluconate 2-dehydrogenase gamma chain